MDEFVNREASTVEDKMDVDRQAVTVDSQGSDEVDRDGITQESEGICDRNAATVDCPPKLVLTIEPPPKETLLKGIPAVPVQKKLHEPLVFGRGNGVDIFLNDDTASKQHMRLFVPSGVTTPEASFVAETVSETKPVYINGQSLKKREQKLLKTGDKLKIAKLTFTVQIIPGDSQVWYEVEFVQNLVNRGGYPSSDAAGMAYAQPQHTFPGSAGFGTHFPTSIARGMSGYPNPTGQLATPQPRVPQQPRYTPVTSPSATDRREFFHTHKKPSENSDQKSDEDSAKLPVQEVGPPK